MTSLSMSMGLSSAAARSRGVSFNLDAFMAAQADGLYFDTTKTDRFFQENTGPTLADDVGEAIGLAMSQRAWDGKTLAELLAGESERITSPRTNPPDTSTVSVLSGTGVISVVNDDAELAVIGLSGNVYRFDNSGSGSVTFFGFSGTAGTNGLFYADAYLRGSGVCRFWASANTPITLSSSYSKAIGFREVSSTDLLALRLDAGAIVYVILPTYKRVPGKHGIQATGTLKPTRQTTGAKFDGSDDNWLTSYAAGAGENFIVALVDVPAILAATQIVVGANGAGTSGRWFLGFDSSTGQLRVQPGGNALTTASADLRGQTMVVGMTWDGTNRTAFAGADAVLADALGAAVDGATAARIAALNNAGAAQSFFGGSIKKLVAGRQFLDLATYRKIRTALLA